MYLTPRGKAYFLPAFLRICQKQPRQADTLPATLLRDIAKQGQRRDQMLSLLNPQQRAYLLHFLERKFSNLSEYADLLAKAKDVLQSANE